MKENQLTVKTLFNRKDVKQKFAEMLGKRSSSFMTSVLQIVAQNTELSKADPTSIYHSAAVAATLELPINNTLGFAYIVPYNKKYQDDKGVWKTKQVAQFQIGYKGFIQLAQRSGQFKTISATPIYEGQITSQNPLSGFEFDFSQTKSSTVIGYAAYFKLLNGFEKTLYINIEDLKKHGLKYSKTFTHKNGLWNTDFDAMATKTTLKLLLSKFAPLSVEMQKAIAADQGLINDVDATDVTYIDNEPESVSDTNNNTPTMANKEIERIHLLINDCQSVEELKKIKEQLPEEGLAFYEAKLFELSSLTPVNN